MATLQERIIGAAMLDTRIYEEVEADQTATSQALIVVVLAGLSSGLASIRLGPTIIVTTILAAVVGWAIWAGLTYIIGTKVMPEPQTHADFGQMLRVLGFAAAPGLLGILAIIPILGVLIRFAIFVWQLVAFVIAVRQGLDYTSTGRAFLVCLIGFVAYVIIMMVVGVMMGGAALLSGAVR